MIGYLVLLILYSLLFCGKMSLTYEAQTEVQMKNSSCNFWSHFNPSNQKCECQNDIYYIVYCESNATISILDGYCMTPSTNGEEALVGACPYNIHLLHKQLCLYIPVPNTLTELDRVFCSSLKRTGQLCGQCVDNSSLPVYSYYMNCVKCNRDTNNWPKYLAVSLLPTTVFFLAVIAFRFRATSPQMNGYILFCQIATCPTVLRVVLSSVLHNKRRFGIPGDLYIAFLSIWNLDFFRALYSPFCLHPNTSTLQVLSLDYITAFYPLVLIVFTYTLVTLHYKNCKFVVWLWRPFIGCFARCRRQWDIQNSLVDAFATFLLLSYVKLFSTSFDLLTPTIMWDKNSRIQIALYYDGSVNYFKNTHLPYALLAISVLLLFTILPILLLCLYPCHCFQKILNRFDLNSQTLHHFMDTFQGCFKDGTNGTKDCRYFVSIYFITRIMIQLGFIVSNNTFSTAIQTTVLLFVVVLLVCFQPYKKSFYNKVDTVFLLTLSFAINLTPRFHNLNARSLSAHIDHLYLLALPVPVFYPLYLILHYTCKNVEMSRVSCIKTIKICCLRFQSRKDVELYEDSALLQNSD